MHVNLPAVGCAETISANRSIFFLILLFQPILFHIIAAEERCMHECCILLSERVCCHVRLWFSKLVMHVKICQR